MTETEALDELLLAVDRFVAGEIDEEGLENIAEIVRASR